MITIISPAKTLDFDSEIPPIDATTPQFVDQSSLVMKQLKKLSKKKIGSLMNLSKDLVELNAHRYQMWEPNFETDAARPALFTFSGEVYRGIDAKSLSTDQLNWAQDHLRILSGLYGLLRPLDNIRPYRLEMGTSLPVGRKKNLYQFWGNQLTEALNMALEATGSATLVNLASSEYFKAADFDKINGEVITPVFKDFKNGEYKIVMTWAKQARGRMTGFILRNGITNPQDLKAFEDYQYNEALSSESEWVFVR
jgi:cytoplasmic iron level regulating protein YaaA (DUF328/UPF0246 family)